MSLERLSDEWVTRMFEGIRKEVAADIGSGWHPLIGEATKQRAKTLADELTRRGIQFSPIDWPSDPNASSPKPTAQQHSTLWRRIVGRLSILTRIACGWPKRLLRMRKARHRVILRDATSTTSAHQTRRAQEVDREITADRGSSLASAK
jgi:hypothetical protein